MSSSNPQLQYPGFHSHKSERPIYYPHRWQRDALIQAVLDPLVTRIGPSVLPISELPWHIHFSFGIEMAGRAVHVLVSDHKIRQGSIEGLPSPYLTLSRKDLLTEPRCTAARDVWSRKRLTVSPNERIRAMELCRAGAPDVTILDVVGVMSSTFSDPIEQVLALLAQGYLAADLNAGLHAGTKVMLGPLAMPGDPRRPLERLRMSARHPMG